MENCKRRNNRFSLTYLFSNSLLLLQHSDIHCQMVSGLLRIFFLNAVKQSGILSPSLFNVSMCDLGVNLNKQQIGCLYAGTIMNHMMYADDLCIFSPNVSGLRNLTYFCAEYGNMFDTTYNANASYCMVIDNKHRD